MDKFLGCFWLFFLLGILPLTFGLPWSQVLDGKISYTLSYAIGFFLQLVLFQLAVTPVVFLRGSFVSVVRIFGVLLLMACVCSLYFMKKNRLSPLPVKAGRLSVFEILYLCAFLAVLGLQVCHGFTFDLTYMSLDDATYTVMAQQALEGQGLGTVNTATGEAGLLDYRYGLPGWLYYPALLSYFSGFSVATVAHTLQYVQLILLAYAVYWYLSGLLFDDRQNRLIFMLLIALFYWYGYHSHYSLTFRLLGPNYQGKAVVAVSLTPLVFALLIRKLKEPFQLSFFWLLLFLGAAACSLSFWGAGTFLVILTLPILISLLIKGRDFRHLLYVVSGSAVPALTAALFFVSKYAV